MPSMKDLLSQRYSLVEAAKAIRDRAKAANRDLTDSELTSIEVGLEAAEAVHAEIQKQDPSSPAFRRDVDGAWAVANTSPGVPRAILGNPGRSGPQDAGNRLPSRFLPPIAGDDVSFG